MIFALGEVPRVHGHTGQQIFRRWIAEMGRSKVVYKLEAEQHVHLGHARKSLSNIILRADSFLALFRSLSGVS